MNLEFVDRYTGGCERAISKLDFMNVFGHRAAITVLYVKAHLLSSGKLLEAGHGNGGEMDEYVRAFFLFDKAVPLLVVKPLNGALRHSAHLLSLDIAPIVSILNSAFGKGNDPFEQGMLRIEPGQ